MIEILKGQGLSYNSIGFVFDISEKRAWVLHRKLKEKRATGGSVKVQEDAWSYMYTRKGLDWEEQIRKGVLPNMIDRTLPTIIWNSNCLATSTNLKSSAPSESPPAPPAP
jgi:hypothetical protein